MDEKRISEKKTERLIMVAKDQSLQGRWVKHYIGRITDSPKCRMC